MISGKTQLYGVIGNPIDHSLSPMIHNYWFQKYKIDAVYIPLSFEKTKLQETFKSLINLNLKGINVTIPFKIDVMSYLDELDDTAIFCGAVNTIKISENKVTGYNTDVFGFLENLKQSVPDIILSNSNALVLGAGGASKAICYGLAKNGIKKLYITNRDINKANKLSDELKIPSAVIPWLNRNDILSEIDLLINTTPLGMNNHPKLDMDMNLIQNTSVVYDLIYNPMDTDLLIAAKKKGCKTINGLGMLLYQAQKAFKHWLDIEPEVTDELVMKLRNYL